DHDEVRELRLALALTEARLEAERTREAVLRAGMPPGSEGSSGPSSAELTESEEHVRTLSEQVLQREAAAKQAEAKTGDVRLARSPELEALEHQREMELRSLALELAHKTEEIDKMKRLTTLFVIVVVVVIAGGLGLAFLLRDTAGTNSTACEGVLNTTSAHSCLGEVVTVEGSVANSGDTERTVFLNLDAPFPDPNRFVIAVEGSTERWGEGLEGKRVQVSGTVEYVVEGVVGINVSSEGEVHVQ
ncbi:MAG: hypothetical protein WBM72_06850, partial [Actinomycetota bacterium]